MTPNWEELMTPLRAERSQEIRDMGKHQCMKFNKGKCWILHLGQGSPGFVYRLGNERLEISGVEKDLDALVDNQTMVKTVVRQTFPLQSMEIHSQADIHLQRKKDPTLEQVNAQKMFCSHGKTMQETSPNDTRNDSLEIKLNMEGLLIILIEANIASMNIWLSSLIYEVETLNSFIYAIQYGNYRHASTWECNYCGSNYKCIIAAGNKKESCHPVAKELSMGQHQVIHGSLAVHRLQFALGNE
ncbi:hypothetical protein WISP_139811 [Willisornis vidua]|uniref:Uncharacterized protein n=1 Tax=Willisornis vidua TaxID=1566151 RepID=A0ABQ9CMD5_9PASS|nr:hypothetical protein WISP_139811 [Willisornis vidua]